MQINSNLRRQLSNLSSVSTIDGRRLSAVEQVLVRMCQEAFLDLSKYVRLSHFIAALAFVPNGPGKFMMSDLLRKEQLNDLELRSKLNLPEFIPSERIDENTQLSESVGLILLEAKRKTAPMVESFQKIPSTGILYDSLVYYFSRNGTKENGEYILLQSILNGRILECN